MSPQGIIQAFSRTNRLFIASKHYGQIVVFQQPDAFKKAVDNALVIYSAGGENDVLAPTFEEETEKFIASVERLREVASTPENAPIIESATIEELRVYAKAFQDFDRLLSSVQVYLDCDIEKLLDNVSLTYAEIEEYTGKYHNVINELKARKEKGEDVPSVDIYYELEMVQKDEINYNYIISLLQAIIDDEDVTMEEESRNKEIINRYIEQLQKTNPALADIVNQLWLQIKFQPDRYRGQSVANILEGMIDDVVTYSVSELASQWFIGEEETLYLVNHYREGSDKQLGEQSVMRSQDYPGYKEFYGEEALSLLKYKKEIKKAYTEVAEEVVLPLRLRN
jgi:type I restriction enzyme R subunit